MFEVGLATLFAKLFIALVAVCNPFWGIPVFLALTDGYTPAERRRTALITSSAVAITATVILLVGKDLLAFFGIHVPSFRIAGGIIILLMALAMLNTDSSKDSGEAGTKHAAKRNIAVVPLAVPYLAGPAVITTVIVFAHSLHDPAGYFTGLLAIACISVILWAGLFFAEPVAKFMGHTGIDIVSRIMAVMLAAIAVEMVLAGIDHHYPNLHDTPAPAASSPAQ